MKDLQILTHPQNGGVVVYNNRVEFVASGKNGGRKCEAFHLLATIGRVRESKRVACAVGLTFKAAEQAIDIYRERDEE